jgi:hypothetical protein
MTPLHNLHTELDRVAKRYRRLLLWTGFAVCWLTLAIAGFLALTWARKSGHAIPGVLMVALLALPLAVLPMLLRWLRRVKNPAWIAHRIEGRFRDLDARLLAALEQKPDPSTGQLGFLQHDVIDQVVHHARTRGWAQIVSRRKLRVAKWGQWAALALFALVIGSLAFDLEKRPSTGSFWLGGIARKYAIKVEPQDTSLERGSGLLVLARFDDEVPTDVTLTYRDADGRSQQIPMSKSLDDPVFAGRVPSVDRDLSYIVKYADNQTRPYKVTVFDYPELKQADARLKFPQYTKLAEKLVEDTRAVTAVEGTKATLTFRLNKPVKDAQLVAAGPNDKSATTKPAPVPLVVDPKDPTVYTVGLDMLRSQRFALDLVDAEGRKPKQATEFTLNVTPNQPPLLKLAWPGKDIDVSPIEEMAVKAQVWDDFGVDRVGLSYAIAGEEPKDIVLAEHVNGKEKRDVATLVSLEQLKAEPDQLMTYHLWVEDLGPDGEPRRTMGDMYFAEVRPFDQIFRQGQQPSDGQQQQQQQQQQQNGNAQRAEELAEAQKQIVNATWKVIRREIKAEPTPELAGDGNLLHESQQKVRKQANAMAERLEDAKSKQHLAAVLKSMDEAIKQLDKAKSPSIKALQPALSAEQAAYQNLLKLRAREHEVVRGNQRQQRGQQSASSGASRRQQQLNQLELKQDENRYETQRRAQEQQQPDDPAAREQRQVLSRLRELAQRQEDLNRQMRELQAAIQRAQEEQQKEELKRQLARLRDQQQEMLRDTDELRDRMDQPQNQQRMADSREQLENTRENVRRASEALEKGMVPDAAASGTRAAEDLNKLRDDFRKGTAGQLAEDMDRLRDEARQLDQRQQELANELQKLDQTEQRKLRDSGERKQVAEGLGEQREQLGGLLKQMQQTTDDAEQSEPLVSRQLHDAAREAARSNTDQSLESTKQMLDRGFVNEARQAEADASKGISKLREGVEKAAESVLGDETEGLRRASENLDRLARELEQELTRNGQAMGPTTRSSNTGRQLAQGGPTTRGAAQSGEQRDGEQRARAGGQQNDQDGPTTRGVAQSGQQRDGQQRQQGEQQARAGGRQQRDGQQQQQPGEGQQQGQQARGGGQQQQQDGQQQGQGEGEQSGQQANARGQDGQQQQQGQGRGQQQQQLRQQEGQARGGGLRGGDPQQEGQQQANAQDPQQRGQRGGNSDLRQLVPDAGEPDGNPQAGGTGPMGGGEQFRDWSDRLRDVEEMVGDPRLRAEAARIRERARSLRAESARHSTEPNWELVREFIGQPLVELRDAVAAELMRKQTSEAMVPIDREPVPPQYVEKVKEYYERLGSGR